MAFAQMGTFLYLIYKHIEYDMTTNLTCILLLCVITVSYCSVHIISE